MSVSEASGSILFTLISVMISKINSGLSIWTLIFLNIATHIVLSTMDFGPCGCGPLFNTPPCGFFGILALFLIHNIVYEWP